MENAPDNTVEPTPCPDLLPGGTSLALLEVTFTRALWLVVAEMDVLVYKNETAIAAHDAGDGSDPDTIRLMKKYLPELRGTISEHHRRREQIVREGDTAAMVAFLNNTRRYYTGPRFAFLHTEGKS